MADKYYSELPDLGIENFLDKEVDCPLNEQVAQDAAENISLNINIDLEENEVPLEYAGHVIGSIKINKEQGQVRGAVDISKSIMVMLLRKTLLVGEQQRENQARELLVSLLLNQENTQPDPTMNILARIFGYDLEDPQVVFVVEFENKEDFDDKSPEWNELRSNTIKITEDFLKFSGGFIVVSYFNGRILVLKNILLNEVNGYSISAKNSNKEKAEPLSRLRKQLISLAESLRQAILLGTKQDVYIGIGECYKGVLGIRNSYQDAFLALNIGKYFKGVRHSQIYHIADFALESMLSVINESEKKKFIERYLGSIKEEKELQETLEIFFQSNLNIAQAAEKAFLHRNTFTYRLDKIQSLTGLNPRSFYDALILAVALIIKQIDSQQLT